MTANSGVIPNGDFVIDAGTPPTSQDYDSWGWHSTTTGSVSIAPVVISSAHSLAGDEAAHTVMSSLVGYFLGWPVPRPSLVFRNT